jgi:tetratricopeptide (TPR) repeat protein
MGKAHGAMSTPEAGEPRTVDGELAHAAAALQAADVEDALGHLATALSLDPTRSEALRLLDEALDRSGARALDLLPIGDGTFFGLVALRARALARLGRPEEALVLLFGVASYRADVPYLPWTPRWFGDGDERGRPGRVGPDQIAGSAVAFFQRVSRKDAENLGVRQNLEGALFALRALRARYPENERLCFAEILASRRLGRDTEALDLARRWFETRPSWISAVELGNTLREQGRVEEAIPCFRQAQAFKPQDMSPLLDIGDILLSGRYEEAARAYAEVLAREPGHPWAEPSHAFAQYRATGDEMWRKVLEELAARAPEGSRARELVARLSTT